MLNGGLTGFTLGHSDTGGFTAVDKLDGLFKYTRT